MRLQKFWSGVDTLLLWLSGIAALACAVHVSLDVLFKYFLASPIPGTINIVSNYYMITLVFAPLAMAELRNAHISVDILSLPSGWAGDLWIRIVYLFNSIVFAAVAYNTGIDAMKKFRVKAFALDQDGLIYIWPGYWILPVGLGLISALSLCKCFSPNLSKTDEVIG